MKTANPTHTKRIICLWLPHLTIERLTRLNSAPDNSPFAVIKSDAKGTNIFAVNQAAYDAGMKPDMRLSDARAICHQLQVREHDRDGDAHELSKMARWVECYSPMVAIYDPGTLLLDITGCAHLFGGEAAMLGDIQQRLARIGYAVRLGLADTIGAAFALARYSDRPITIIAPDRLHQGLAFLPVRALRLPQKQADNLYSLGLKTIGQLFDIPRASLARRFSGLSAKLGDGIPVLKRLDQALGLVGEPLEPHRHLPPFRVSLNPAEPCLHHEGIKAVFDTLLNRLLDGLEQQSQGLRKLDFQCFYTDGGEKTLTASFAKPSRIKKHIEILFTDQLLNLDPRFGFDGFVLSSEQTDSTHDHQDNLLEPENQQAGKLSELIDRLVNRLGKQAVFQITGYESHLPERAQNRTMPLSVIPTQAGIQGSFAQSSPITLDSRLRGNDDPLPHRPITIFARPETITVIAEIPEGPPMQFRWRRVLRQVTRARGPERIAPEWWTANASSQRLRDYYEVEDANGQRYWLFRAGLYDDHLYDGPNPASPPQWYIHGLFL